MTPACDEHDRGYCTCGASKSDVDAQMLEDMKDICDGSDEDDDMKTFCKSRSYMAYAAVVSLVPFANDCDWLLGHVACHDSSRSRTVLTLLMS